MKFTNDEVITEKKKKFKRKHVKAHYDQSVCLAFIQVYEGRR